MTEKPSTYAPPARTEHFDLGHIGKGKIEKMEDVFHKTEAERIGLMRQIFNGIDPREQLQIIENDKDK